MKVRNNNKDQFKGMRTIIENKTGHYKYIGGRKGEKRHGYGKQTWDTGVKCEGYYQDNQLSGISRIFSPSGKIFAGYFNESKADGYGLLRNKSKGVCYEGEWESNNQYNISIETWKDGSIFQGEYYEGQRNGIGTYISSDQTIYEGEFRENEICGYV
jgi:hypothetical protein